ncbi:MAG TPA: MmgE/PrpD family protein [Jatrophihabitans sp.]|nr:MmgE/PrpD family protein [Jatrophihabitans sp.]
MTTTAERLAAWAADLAPNGAELKLAQRSLVDTVAVILAAREEPLARIMSRETQAAQWSALAHILDFDDLHMQSTTHISAVCVPAVLSSGGGAREYLAAAGVMARIGSLLGWPHYAAGWHATTTAGAPAAAVGAALAMGLEPEGVATAIALAVPAAGGVQRSFGTYAKPLQVGFAAEAGVRAARLAANGARAEPGALDQWLNLMGVDGAEIDLGGEAVPGGLAVKLFPCCYAMQRPIALVRDLDLRGIDPDAVQRIVMRTPEATIQPLIHPSPTNGLQAKFSLQYAVAVTLLDHAPGFDSFADEAVRRPAATALMSKIVVETSPGGDWLLDGELEITIEASGRDMLTGRLKLPPGSPTRPPSAEDMRGKVERCCPDLAGDVMELDWSAAADLLDAQLRDARLSVAR